MYEHYSKGGGGGSRVCGRGDGTSGGSCGGGGGCGDGGWVGGAVVLVALKGWQL